MRHCLAFIFLLAGCGTAAAPPVKEIGYVLREAYVRDTGSAAKPFTYKDCEINRGFRKANPSPIDGYEHVLMCVPIGER